MSGNYMILEQGQIVGGALSLEDALAIIHSRQQRSQGYAVRLLRECEVPAELKAATPQKGTTMQKHVWAYFLSSSDGCEGAEVFASEGEALIGFFNQLYTDKTIPEKWRPLWTTLNGNVDTPAEKAGQKLMRLWIANDPDPSLWWWFGRINLGSKLSLSVDDNA